MKWSTRKSVISLVLSAGVLAGSVWAQNPPGQTPPAQTTATGQNIPTDTPGTRVLPLAMGFQTPQGEANNNEELIYPDGRPSVKADAQFPEDLNGLKPTEAGEGYASPGSDPGYQATWTNNKTGPDGQPTQNAGPPVNGDPNNNEIADTQFTDPGGYQIGNHSIAGKTPPPNIDDPPPPVAKNPPEINDPPPAQDPNNPPSYEGQSNVFIHDNTPPNQLIAITVLDEETGGQTSTDNVANSIEVKEDPINAPILNAGANGKSVKFTMAGSNFKPANSETAQVMDQFGKYNVATGQVEAQPLNINTLPYPANNALVNVTNEFEFTKNQRLRVALNATDNWEAVANLKLDIQMKVIPEEGTPDRATFEKDPSGGAGILTIRDKDTKVKLTFIALDRSTHPRGEPNGTYTTVTFRVKDTAVVVDQVEGEGETETRNAPTTVPTGGGTD